MTIKREYITVGNPDRNVTWRIEDILYFECSKNYIVAYTENDQIHFRATMQELHDMIDGYGFMLVNKGVLVNEKKIDACRKYEITLKNGKVFTVSRRRYNLIYDRMKKVNMFALFLI